MAKKDEAFALFDQGKRPSDPEVKALGLKSKSTYSYFQDWKQLQEPAVPVVAAPPVVALSKVVLGNIPDGSLFEYRGQVYKKRHQVYSGQIIALLMNRAQYTTVYTPMGESVYLSPDVIVVLK